MSEAFILPRRMEHHLIAQSCNCVAIATQLKYLNDILLKEALITVPRHITLYAYNLFNYATRPLGHALRNTQIMPSN